MIPMTRAKDDTRLYLAIELSGRSWKLAFQKEVGRARIRNVSASDLEALLKEIEEAKKRFGLTEQTEVRACYEAGQEGFWLYRYLTRQGIDVLVVDSSSIEVPRKGRHLKTDRLDAQKLLEQLIQHTPQNKRFQVLVVPSEAQEDERRLHRERSRLIDERNQHTSRLRALLTTQGVRCKKLPSDLTLVTRPWDGAELPKYLRAELEREAARLAAVNDDIKVVEREMAKCILADGATAKKVQTLSMLKAVGPLGAHIFAHELCWRSFSNRRQVASAVGLTGSPYQSGEVSRDQGLGKAGNKRVRTLVVELAWAWLRYQPASQLSQWFNERFAKGGGRARKVGIVALARKLTIALWRFAEQGVVPPGALLKAP